MTRRGQDGQQPLLGVGAPGIRLICGDSLAVLPTLAADSVDAIVTDPPYGLAFMGKDWDDFGRQQPYQARGGYQDKGILPGYGRGGTSEQREKFRYTSNQEFYTFSLRWSIEALRVAKPGAHMLVFGGSRTYHRLACAVEDAGWEIRDCLMFLHGSGFPKGQDVGKAIKREGFSDTEAAVWVGWNSQLKPAYETILLCRKPLAERTVARNCLAHGVGALHVDACRVPTAPDDAVAMARCNTSGSGRLRGRDPISTGRGNNGSDAAAQPLDTTQGRYPATVLHDGGAEVEAAFAAYGARGQWAPVQGTEPSSPAKHVYGTYARSVRTQFQGRVESAARFFYSAKASGEDREFANDHPTLKPLALMRWCVRLITPPKGVVLDLFMGSGSTGRACAAEGVGFIGIEREAAYAAIAQRRLLVKDLEVIG